MNVVLPKIEQHESRSRGFKKLRQLRKQLKQIASPRNLGGIGVKIDPDKTCSTNERYYVSTDGLKFFLSTDRAMSPTYASSVVWLSPVRVNMVNGEPSVFLRHGTAKYNLLSADEPANLGVDDLAIFSALTETLEQFAAHGLQGVEPVERIRFCLQHPEVADAVRLKDADRTEEQKRAILAAGQQIPRLRGLMPVPLLGVEDCLRPYLYQLAATTTCNDKLVCKHCQEVELARRYTQVRFGQASDFSATCTKCHTASAYQLSDLGRAVARPWVSNMLKARLQEEALLGFPLTAPEDLTVTSVESTGQSLVIRLQATTADRKYILETPPGAVVATPGILVRTGERFCWVLPTEQLRELRRVAPGMSRDQNWDWLQALPAAQTYFRLWLEWSGVRLPDSNLTYYQLGLIPSLALENDVVRRILWDITSLMALPSWSDELLAVILPPFVQKCGARRQLCFRQDGLRLDFTV